MFRTTIYNNMSRIQFYFAHIVSVYKLACF